MAECIVALADTACNDAIAKQCKKIKPKNYDSALKNWPQPDYHR
ncbi:MAG: hypothetical protein ACREUM_11755 [Nitrosospira sp.]